MAAWFYARLNDAILHLVGSVPCTRPTKPARTQRQWWILFIFDETGGGAQMQLQKRLSAWTAASAAAASASQHQCVRIAPSLKWPWLWLRRPSSVPYHQSEGNLGSCGFVKLDKYNSVSGAPIPFSCDQHAWYLVEGIASRKRTGDCMNFTIISIMNSSITSSLSFTGFKRTLKRQIGLSVC